MKTKEELKQIKEEYKELNKKLAELSEEELKQVAGGFLSEWEETLDLEEDPVVHKHS